MDGVFASCLDARIYFPAREIGLGGGAAAGVI